MYWGDGNICVKKGNSMVRKFNIFFSFFVNYNFDDVDVGIFIGFGFFGRWIFEGILIFLMINDVYRIM